MHTLKRWHGWLIFAIIGLTIYNILPTIFFYSNPLKKKISEETALAIGKESVARVHSLEEESLAWVKAQAKNIGVHLKEVKIDPNNVQLIHLTLATPEEGNRFAKILPQAGSLIPFIPAQLQLAAHHDATVTLRRHIGVDFPENNTLFKFVPKETAQGDLSPEYRALMIDRAALLIHDFIEPSEWIQTLSFTEPSAPLQVARTLVEFEKKCGQHSLFKSRLFGYLFRGSPLSMGTIQERLYQAEKELEKNLDSSQGGEEMVALWKDQLRIIKQAQEILHTHSGLFTTEKISPSIEEIRHVLDRDNTYILEYHPIIQSIGMDWNHEQIVLHLFSDIPITPTQSISSESDKIAADLIRQWFYQQLTHVSRDHSEQFIPQEREFIVHFHELTGCSSLLTLDLKQLALQEDTSILTYIRNQWNYTAPELAIEHLPIMRFSDFGALPKEQQRLGIVVYTPILEKNPQYGSLSSIYIIAKGWNRLQQRGDKNHELRKELESVQELFRSLGCIHYSGSFLAPIYKDDLVFEFPDFASFFLAATREHFLIKGSKTIASLELSTYEQRLLTKNKIESRIHEDLLKWRDEYQSSRVQISGSAASYVPKPIHNVYWKNFLLSTKKYFRGDERKIVKWGLDLSGGKTVRIGLKNANGEDISDPMDLSQARNELYQRVNKLGMGDISVYLEGSTIVLNFPGSQEISASELVEASTMFFHIVNEKFSLQNASLAEAVNTFLDEVYSEAVITNRTDLASLNSIAWEHLGGNLESSSEYTPTTSHAKLLYDQGLRFAPPGSPPPSYQYDDTLSSIGIYRAETSHAWNRQSHPLVILFRNYALEGKNLTSIQTGYDPSKGNILHFAIQGSAQTAEGEKYHPRDMFYDWTSAFAEEKIVGTPKEQYSKGHGWRMAVVLNGTIIQSPTLSSALRDHASISGSFSQREIQQLAADLKAGSLSFSPKILSEENISPELGKEQRQQGILASIIGLILVVALLCLYYRFGGFVASVAVLFNLLIIWGVLQNVRAALTLPGIAGIILTMGMAVDANVLVFERIREEFGKTKRLANALIAGYKKAFSAIFDSNITTVIAALILLHFDSGPIKGFAYTLIIGIVSSMFTALFMTRFFFIHWVRNPEHKDLSMCSIFTNTHYSFLKYSKIAVLSVVFLVLVGGWIGYQEKGTLMGMDLTGGYTLTVDVQPSAEGHYSQRVLQALHAAGVQQGEATVKTLNKENRLKIQLAKSMNLPGHPFYALSDKHPTHSPYEVDPKINWIIQALENNSLHLQESSLSSLQTQWVAISGQLSSSMRTQALIGLGCALCMILFYIAWRFEWMYAVSATLALVHDLIASLACVAIFHYFYPQVQIDMQIIAALMTIIGYSLNDTIIIFDRIRESLPFATKTSFGDLINQCLNATLSRTLMTSATTFVVLLALVCFGGSSIFGFALIMSCGVVIGTFSSIFIASPLLLYFHEHAYFTRQQKKVAS